MQIFFLPCTRTNVFARGNGWIIPERILLCLCCVKLGAAKKIDHFLSPFAESNGDSAIAAAAATGGIGAVQLRDADESFIAWEPVALWFLPVCFSMTIVLFVYM